MTTVTYYIAAIVIGPDGARRAWTGSHWRMPLSARAFGLDVYYVVDLFIIRYASGETPQQQTVRRWKSPTTRREFAQLFAQTQTRKAA